MEMILLGNNLAVVKEKIEAVGIREAENGQWEIVVHVGRHQYYCYGDNENLCRKEFAKILSELEGNPIPYEKLKKIEPPTIKEEIRFDDLNVSTRLKNCMKMAGIETLGEASHYGKIDFLRIEPLGKKTLEELESVFEKYGLDFDTEPCTHIWETISRR